MHTFLLYGPKLTAYVARVRCVRVRFFGKRRPRACRRDDRMPYPTLHHPDAPEAQAEFCLAPEGLFVVCPTCGHERPLRACGPKPPHSVANLQFMEMVDQTVAALEANREEVCPEVSINEALKQVRAVMRFPCSLCYDAHALPGSTARRPASDDEAGAMLGTPKLDAMVEAMTRYMQHYLAIEDDIQLYLPNLVPETTVRLFHSEVRHMCTPKDLGHVQEVERLYTFTTIAEDLACRILLDARLSDEEGRSSFDVGRFTAIEHYRRAETIKLDSERDECAQAGGLGLNIATRAGRLAATWVREVDEALCKAGGIESTRAATGELDVLFLALAARIARRCAFRNTRPDLDAYRVLVEELDPPALLGMLGEHERKVAGFTSETGEQTLAALRLLQDVIAEPRSPRARQVVTQRAAELRAVLDDRLPIELAQAASALQLDGFEFARLCDALDAQWEEARVALVQNWAESNAGRAVGAATRAAIAAMERRGASRAVLGREVTLLATQRSPGATVVLPECTAVGLARRHVVGGADPRRGALDECGLRAVRLVGALVELVEAGEFPPGHARVGIVAAAAFESVYSCRAGAAQIMFERSRRAHGKRLLRHLFVLADNEGTHQREMRVAACELSHFSMHDLETALHPNGVLFSHVIEGLYWSVKGALPFYVDDHYRSFVADALPYALASVNRYRGCLGIAHCASTLPAIDIMHVNRKVLEWLDPVEHGQLVLDAEDLRQGHPLLRQILEELSKRGALVKRVGGPPSHKKLQFKFHSPSLLRLKWLWATGGTHPPGIA